MSAYQALKQPAEVAIQSIGFLLTDNFSLITLAAVLEPLRRANQFSGSNLYRWRTLTMDGRPVRANSGMLVSPDGAATSEDDLDALIICGAENIQRRCDPEQIRLLQRHADLGTHLGSLGSGSWLLANAGLLDGYECCTSWEYRVDLQEAFPGIVLSTQHFVLDRDRYTAGNGSDGADLMLQLIMRSHGPVLAEAISETLVLERIRSEQVPQRLTLRQTLGGSQPKLQEAIGLMEANLEKPIELEKLANFVGLSRRQLERLFCQYMHCSPSRYYLKLRLLQARQLLKQTALPISNIAVSCGFISAQHFSKCYREHFGSAPSGERQDRSPRLSVAMH
ncbi:GlxA family transcriptional regulator [Pseudomonas benzenivorans]|uniref:GlxA family transcriptional regulator n=1 Tax=Pseudomonas benzenivorans TaxID=556533 RepID=A0ABY5H9S7_9PSED|nr:GlxA family transcriptional regulator [Pseudomonas benzenivorans]UTW08132.1 GlxA family transcriptional regulator [Pseudomonas benzenivorans]